MLRICGLAAAVASVGEQGGGRRIDAGVTKLSASEGAMVIRSESLVALEHLSERDVVVFLWVLPVGASGEFWES